MRIGISLLLFLATMNTWSQSSDIKKKQITINGIEVLGVQKAVLISHFGKPITTNDFYFEMNDENGKIYIYEGAKFFIQNDLIDSFEVTDQKFELTNHKIRIGDKISTLADVFPDCYLNRKNSGLQLEISEADLYVVISYGSIDEKITKFAIYNF
ncbi:MAG: hypothetical protein CMB99_09675 [Flavobacteriaceae bacterium]|nr:hypothetical protein [Flavobacteriaceae bacterium]|tara:strand:+ start:400390 stop:400854 length:465 start_codon:yes stop_codon:yes gene_type:complete